MKLSREGIGRRVAEAREAAGRSQSDLAEAVGLGQSAVSRIETGERSLDSIELAAIADSLGVSVLDLLQSQPLAQSLRVAARSQHVANPASLDRAIDRVADIAEIALAVGIDETPSTPACAPARASGIDRARRLAEALREEWGLDDDPLPDLYGLIEDRARIYVVLEPLVDGVDGLCARTDDLVVILVDSSAIYGRQRFTAAHELCHFLTGDGAPLHVDETLFGQGDGEMHANAFAAHFLMPQKGIERYLRGRHVDGHVATELQYTFGVSLDALLWHLKNLALIDEATRQQLAGIGAKSLAYRHGYAAEWQRIEGQRGVRRPPGRLLTRALDAYARGALGIEPVARLWGRRDTEALREELESHGIGRSDRWWEATAPA